MSILRTGLLAVSLCTFAAVAQAAPTVADAPSAPGASAAAPAAKIVNLYHCPITQAPVKNNGKGGQVVDGYRVQFCCGGCPEEFAKLTPAQKREKIDAIVKLEKAAEKPAAH